MKSKKLPLSAAQFLQKIDSLSRLSSEGLEKLSPYLLIKMMRTHLHMTQAQLAKRVGFPQSYIAKIEGGTVDIQVGTLKKIFESLQCDTLVLPKPTKPLHDILVEQAKLVAAKKVAHLQGTMSLEKQNIDKSMSEKLRQDEENRLLYHPSSELWED